MSFGDLLATAFYGATFLALGYFVHKVFWLTRFRSLQARLVQEAAAATQERTHRARSQWKSKASKIWRELRGELKDQDAELYSLRVEQELVQLREAIRAKSVRKDFVERLFDAEPAPEIEPLSIKQRKGRRDAVSLRPAFGRLEREPAPDETNFQLALRSRYGILRRALVFFLGAADVVYSSQHLARMSQNAQMPLGVLLRRLSLVVLIVSVVLVDIALGARRRLIHEVDLWMHGRFKLPGHGFFTDTINDNAPTLIALGLWLAAYGLVYVGLYLFLYSKSQQAVRHLQQLNAGAAEQREQIYQHHLTQLRLWVDQFAHTLDEATDITVSQASMLTDRAIHRLRQRIVPQTLLVCAEELSKRIFKKLPEASTSLQDAATSYNHSFRHNLWPRIEEMNYQREFARYRSAWQYLESTLSDLQSEVPHAEQAFELWGTLEGYKRLFPELDAEEVLAPLDDVLPQTLEQLISGTEAELIELDRELEELVGALQDKFDTASSLVESRIEVTRNAMRSDLNQLSREILRAREQARLEAMAFEI
ncbi:MAG: hypothetical protein R3B89_34495 [Polyangiaceae bacterium]